MIGRRSFLTGFASLIAAPAIVRASSLIPVKVMQCDNAALREWLLPSGPWKLNYGVPDFDPAFLQHIQKYPIEEARRCHS